MTDNFPSVTDEERVFIKHFLTYRVVCLKHLSNLVITYDISPTMVVDNLIKKNILVPAEQALFYYEDYLYEINRYYKAYFFLVEWDLVNNKCYLRHKYSSLSSAKKARKEIYIPGFYRKNLVAHPCYVCGNVHIYDTEVDGEIK